MFTVCPKCALTLVVTAADLRIAQGYVRCGRCSSVFNALARLTDDRQAAESLSEAQQQPLARAESRHAAESGELQAHPEPHGEESQDEASREEAPPAKNHGAPPASTAAPSAAPVSAPSASAEEEAIPESALEFDPSTTDVGAVFIVPPPDPAWAAATGTFKSMIAHAHGTTPEGSPSDGSSSEESSSEESSSEASSLEASSAAETSPEGSSVEESLIERSASRAGKLTESLSIESLAASPEPGVPEATHPPPGASAAAGEPESSAIGQQRPALPARSAPTRGPEAARTVRSRPGPRQTLHERPPLAAAPRRPGPGNLQQGRDQDRDLTAAVNLIDDSVLPEGHGAVRVRARVWGVAAGIAALVLLAQIVHHYRDELAVQAGLYRPLTALYAALGIPLMPRWDVRSYDVRQLGAVASPATAGLITVRASIKNAAHQAQPFPLLRVTMQDRFGNRIAARDVAPRSYLSHAISPSAVLGAGQRIDAEMGLVDPGANAVGFEIDACLPQRGGGIICANDSATR